ncbi:MAG: hypothetical protein ABL952_01185 [Pyrinomonadaceae bacterium]
MMLGFVEIFDLAALETLFVGIPESVGLLAFGIGLVGVAILIRRFMGRGETSSTDRS